MRLLHIVPILLGLFYSQFFMVLVLYVIAAVTDCLDGLIARKFDYQTRFGALLDPIADKCLIASTSIMLWYINLLPWWVLSVVVLRDLLLISAIGIYRLVYGPYQAKPLLLGKINTVVQLILIIVVIVKQLISSQLMNEVMFSFFILLVISSILSGIRYIVLGLQRHWRAL